MCKSCSRQCGCPCEPEDIILSAIGFPFCMRCEHPLALHDYKTSGEHPIPEHRMKAAAERLPDKLILMGLDTAQESEVHSMT